MLLAKLLGILLTATFLVNSLSPARAQSPASTNGILVGVITSRAGEARVTGASQALAASAWADQTAAAGGVYGVPVEVRVMDDGGVPGRALAAAEELINAGAHALICCTTATAARSVAQLAERAGVLLVSPSDPAQARFGDDPAYWTFSLWPDETDALSGIVAHASSTGRGSLALMTLDNEFGAGASETLAALLGYAGMSLTTELRYSPGVRELRPDALLIASQQPGGVVVWGFAEDTQRAVAALRARGYEGAVYARSALLAPGSQSLDLGSFANVQFAVPPSVPAASLAGSAVASDQPCAEAVGMNRERLAQQYGGVARLDAAAPVLDALDAIATGVEFLITIQLPPSASVEVLRQAIRDAVVGQGEHCGASGLIDFQEGRRSAIVPRGLVAVAIGQFGGLELR